MSERAGNDLNEVLSMSDTSTGEDTSTTEERSRFVLYVESTGMCSAPVAEAVLSCSLPAPELTAATLNLSPVVGKPPPTYGACAQRVLDKLKHGSGYGG